MKSTRILSLIVGLSVGAATSAVAQQPVAPKADSESRPSETPAPKSHPLKGVVVDLMPERQGLLVKHEDIPGVMRAMTMLLKVEPEVLERVKKGDHITAMLSRRSDGWWLHDVKVVDPS